MQASYPDPKQSPSAPAPNGETIAAMEEGDKIIESGKGRFMDDSEMFDDLDIWPVRY